MARRKGSILGGIIFSALFIVGGWMAYQHITKPMGEEASASELWPKTTGTVTSAKIKTSKSDNTTMYAADIVYSYTVDDEHYSSSRISVMGGGSTSSQSSAKKTIKKYARDKKVEVYYDPEFPSISVLEPGQSIWIWLVTYLPLVFCFLGALILLKSILRIFRNLLF